MSCLGTAKNAEFRARRYFYLQKALVMLIFVAKRPPEKLYKFLHMDLHTPPLHTVIQMICYEQGVCLLGMIINTFMIIIDHHLSCLRVVPRPSCFALSKMWKSSHARYLVIIIMVLVTVKMTMVVVMVMLGIVEMVVMMMRKIMLKMVTDMLVMMVMVNMMMVMVMTANKAMLNDN